jgi:uncharacterized surface anchored protein
MLKSKKRLITSWIMALAMVLNVFSSYSTVHAAGVEDRLTNLDAKISQGEKTIGDGGTLSSTENVNVEISFGVPVEGDDPTPDNPIKLGDTAVFELGDDFGLVSTGKMELNSGENLVGYVTLSQNPGEPVIATITFNGDPDVFSGETGIQNVNCKFNANLKFDDSGAPDDGQTSNVSILNKSFTMKVPAKEKNFTLEKTGSIQSDRTVEWTVTVKGTQGNNELDLKDFKFSDDLSEVGNYTPNSFLINGTGETPEFEGNNIYYTFPENSKGTQTIKFRTDIPEEMYFGVGQQNITNNAKLLDSTDTVKVENGYTVSFTPQWIEKSGSADNAETGGFYNSKNRTITWTIYANHMGAELENVKITDDLQGGLELDNAYWQTMVGETEGPVNPITPDGAGVYLWNELNSKIKLTIVTKVPNEEYASGVKYYNNSASMKWDGLSEDKKIDTGNKTVGVGFNPIDKKGVVNTADQTVSWTINVDTKKQSIPNMAVYDLLVYGSSNSGIDFDNEDEIPNGLDINTLTPSFNQKYVDDSFDDTKGIALNVIHLKKGEKVVADLLQFTNLSSIDANTITFKSLVVNPDIVAGNDTSKVSNTGTLFSGNKKLNDGPFTVNYDNKSLSKMMLKRDAIINPIAGVNNSTSNEIEGFDYINKSAVFRLVVNADGLDFNSVKNAAGEVLGKATVKDTLPKGWEFQELSAGVKYLVFEGTRNADGTVTAADTPLDKVTGLTSNFEDGSATFTFDSLNKPYVILVKAGPTDKTAAEYFSKNQNPKVENKVTLKAEKWDKGVSSSQWVKVDSTILDKSVDPTAKGILTWTVDYKPYDLEQKGSKLSDKLPAGIDLRTDSKGNLILEGNIAVQEMTLNADGSYTTGASVELIVGDNITYDNKSRILNFEIPDMAKAYRFTYITDVTGEPGDITNEVSLMGNDSFGVPIGSAYKISAMDSSATMQKKGWIAITKEDGQGNTLDGVEFTIFSEDGETIIRQGVTASNGTLRLKAIPDGEYVLQETKTLEGYVLDSRDHRLSVTQAVAYIDGRTGTDGNKITIKNYPENSVGNLTISKTVTGNDADKDKVFDFTVTFTGADESYDYVGSGVANGTIQSGDIVSLAHGQSITIIGLPKDSTYTVSEADYSGEGYVKESTGESGKIIADSTQTAAFTNTKNKDPEIPDKKTGSLIISKTVAGIKGDKTKKFDFKVAISGADGIYDYTGSGVADGTIKSGDTISLAHGQSITIKKLPAGASYTVDEADYTDKGYTKVSTGEAGTISSDKVLNASFTNTRNTDVTEPEKPNKPEKPSTDNTTKPDSGNTKKPDQDTGVKKDTVKTETQKSKSGAPVTGDQQLGWILLSAGAMTMALAAAARVLYKKHSNK